MSEGGKRTAFESICNSVHFCYFQLRTGKGKQWRTQEFCSEGGGGFNKSS